MKKFYFLALGMVILSGVVFTSCEELLDFGVNVDTDYTYVDFVIEPTADTGERVFSSNVMQTNLDSLLEGTDVTRQEVSSIILKEAIIELQNEDPAITFDSFKNVEATIEAVGLPEIVVAYVDTVPEGIKSMPCKVTNKELIEYLEGNEYILRARGESISPIGDTLYIQGKLKFSVTTDIAETLQ